MSKTMIYADHAATTAMSSVAYEAMLPWLQNRYGNPSTLYSLARDPRKAVVQSREVIANAIHANPSEIFFTSGGTEADNWALKGTLFQHERGKGIITSAIEHHAILNSCAALERMGYSINMLPVDHEGVVNADALRSTLASNTVLVSVMLANNEIGTIEPVAELAHLAHQMGVLFHTDAVQAVGHIPVDVNVLQVDMLSASAHKFNGPKGIGFLYLRNGVHIAPLLDGGGQERGMRAGTENVAGIVGNQAHKQEAATANRRHHQYGRGTLGESAQSTQRKREDCREHDSLKHIVAQQSTHRYCLAKVEQHNTYAHHRTHSADKQILLCRHIAHDSRTHKTGKHKETKSHGKDSGTSGSRHPLLSRYEVDEVGVD